MEGKNSSKNNNASFLFEKVRENSVDIYNN